MSTAEDRAWQQSCRRFATDVVEPAAAAIDQNACVPGELIARIGAEGLWGAVLPAGVQGRGQGMVRFEILHEEIGRACSSVRSLMTVHSMVLHALHSWGSSAARDRWEPRLAAGDLIGGFCLTEEEAGSDASAIAATAVSDGAGVRLNGTKLWTTGGQTADVLLVFARWDGLPTAFLVDAHQDGVRRQPCPPVFGTRGSMVSHIRLTDAYVEPYGLVGGKGMGLAILAGVLDIGRLSVAAGAVGLIRACLEASVAHVNSRFQGGSLLRDHQLVQRKIAQMFVTVQTAQLLCRHAAELEEARSPAMIGATCAAKYYSSVGAVSAANDAVQLHGARGLTEDAAVVRYLRDAKVIEVIEGSPHIHEQLLAQEAYAVSAQVRHEH